MVIKQLRTAFILLLLFSLLTGLIYPFVITELAQLFFPWKANGSLIQQNGKIIGSKWIGQSFKSPEFFQGRLSATSPFPYNATYSSGSNIGPTHPLLLQKALKNIAQLHKLNPNSHTKIPIDLITNSASGLDPDISPLAAYYQVPRIAKIRGISEDALNTIIQHSITQPYAGFIGDPRINVLELNLALLFYSSSNKSIGKTGGKL